MTDLANQITAGMMRAEEERMRELYDVADFANRAWKIRREFGRDLVAHWEVCGETYAKMLRSGPRVTAHTTSPYDVLHRTYPAELQLFGIRVERVGGRALRDLFLVVSA